MKKLLLLSALTFPLLAQIPDGIRSVPTLPTHCYSGPLYSEIVYQLSVGVFACSATDTWSAVGSGISGNQTANTFLAGPATGVPAPATFRVINGADLPGPGFFSLGGIVALAATPSTFLTGVTTSGAWITGQPAASDLTNGTSGTGAVCLVGSCTLATPIIGNFTLATHTHANAANGGLLTNSAINPANLQGNGTKFQMSTTVSGTSGLTFCTDASGNATTTGCSTGSASNPVISHVFGGSGEFGYVHNLNTLNPIVTCYDHTTTLGVIPGLNVSTPATLTTSYITVTAAETVDCAFSNGSGASGVQGATGATGPAGPAPAGSGAVIVTGGVVSTLPGTATSLLHGNAAGAPTFSALATADITNNAITSAKLAVANTRFSCDLLIGTQSTSTALVNAQLGPENDMCYIPAAATLVEINVTADGGTPNVVVGRNRAGSIVNLTSSALSTAGGGGFACSNIGGTTSIDGRATCSATLQNTSLNVGDLPGLVNGTAGGVAKAMRIHVVFLIN